MNKNGWVTRKKSILLNSFTLRELIVKSVSYTIKTNMKRCKNVILRKGKGNFCKTSKYPDKQLHKQV